MSVNVLNTDERPRGSLSEATKKNDDRSSRAHRQFIGYCGLLLPILLWLIAGLRPGEGLPRWEVLDSISAYYYTGAVAAFVGILVALAVFLFTYRGYDNEYQWRDRTAAFIAATAAAFVAFFPTAAPIEALTLDWWREGIADVHYAAAAILFLAFSFFCLFQFPKSKAGSGEPLPRAKRARNVIYYLCGGVILLCILWVWWADPSESAIFWPEALALESFAFSWLVKGRVDRTAVAVSRGTAHYVRHPGQLVGRLRRAGRA